MHLECRTSNKQKAMGNQRAYNKGCCQPPENREGRHCFTGRHSKKHHSPPEWQMEGERTIAFHEDEEPHRGTQSHNQGPTDRGCIQCSWTCHERKYADDCQNDNDDAPSSQVPACACKAWATPIKQLPRRYPGMPVAADFCMAASAERL